MKPTPTLRDRVWQISIGTFLVTIVLMFTSFTLYSMKKAKLAEEHVINELTNNIESQVNQFLPSFLLPEQKQGIDLLLERIKKNEGLKETKIVKGQSDIDFPFNHCKISQTDITTCTSQDQRLTAVVAPLRESNELFGYLFKSKENVSPNYLKEIVQVAFLSLIVLGVVFVGIYIFISRLLSRTLPAALDDLVSWIEADINGMRADKIDLPFKELEDLKIKISEVLDRYNSSRDQAIIGQLTSGIMHDIKTPLQSIVSAMYLVEEQEASSPKRLSRLENAHLMSKTNLPIICNIIETTLDGNRSIKVNKHTDDIVKTIESSIKQNEEMAALRNVEILRKLPCEKMIPHDSTQFMRVVNNLVKNAIEAAADSKDKQTILISAEESESEIRLSVEDSGCGISGHPDKIFKAFRTSKARGTGLGLVITKKIVEAHGGKIVASKSAELGGAQMVVSIPNNRTEAVL